MSKFHKVLVIWSEVPDSISDFVILHLDDLHFSRITDYHDKYIGGFNSDEAFLEQEMIEFFYDSTGNFRFNDKKIKGSIWEDHFDVIIRCGQLL